MDTFGTINKQVENIELIDIKIIILVKISL